MPMLEDQTKNNINKYAESGLWTLAIAYRPLKSTTGVVEMELLVADSVEQAGDGWAGALGMVVISNSNRLKLVILLWKRALKARDLIKKRARIYADKLLEQCKF